MSFEVVIVVEGSKSIKIVMDFFSIFFACLIL